LKVIKSVLITQSKPETERSPYEDIIRKYNVKIDFFPFIHIEGIPSLDFRKERISILDHSAVIFTSRNAVDHFFRICNESRVNIPETMKYFCVSESTACYLQRYVLYRKRKIFWGNLTFRELMSVLKKHKGENYLLPCTDIAQPETTGILDEHDIKYTKAPIYKTVCSDLSELKEAKYDILVFFSPSGVKSLLQNFPDFQQNETRIAAFGPATTKAVLDSGLRLDINAPVPHAPSMTTALELYIKEANKKT